MTQAQVAIYRDQTASDQFDPLALVRDKGTRRFVVAGGETSGAVTQALGVTQLNVGQEIAPGVPWCTCDSADIYNTLALKSGNFGDDGFFATALRELKPA
tara:strand:- start:800 stop:1099 length:300 start_codon:yes stop_codon:yes gene_type:complete